MNKIIVLLSVIAFLGCTDSKVNHTSKVKYLERLSTFETKLIRKGPAPQDWVKEMPPKGVKEVFYESDSLALKAWFYMPQTEKKAVPALVYFHGGFAFGSDDFFACKPFIDAGFAVMCPMLRGENGNPGNFELLMGEVRDAIASVYWVASQKGINTNQIYCFGHSSGGMLSALVSLHEGVPVAMSGSAGGLYGIEFFDYWPELVPFKTSDIAEKQLRLLVGNIADMKTTHIAYVGKDDKYQAVSQAEKEKDTSSRLEIVFIEGDHFTSLVPSEHDFLSKVISRF